MQEKAWDLNEGKEIFIASGKVFACCQQGERKNRIGGCRKKQNCAIIRFGKK